MLDKYLLYVYVLQELQDGKENAQSNESNAIFVIGSRRFKFWRPCEEPIDESKPLGCPELRKNRKDLRVFRDFHICLLRPHKSLHQIRRGTNPYGWTKFMIEQAPICVNCNQTLLVWKKVFLRRCDGTASIRPQVKYPNLGDQRNWNHSKEKAVRMCCSHRHFPARSWLALRQRTLAFLQLGEQRKLGNYWNPRYCTYQSTPCEVFLRNLHFRLGVNVLPTLSLLDQDFHSSLLQSSWGASAMFGGTRNLFDKTASSEMLMSW